MKGEMMMQYIVPFWIMSAACWVKTAAGMAVFPIVFWGNYIGMVKSLDKKC